MAETPSPEKTLKSFSSLELAFEQVVLALNERGFQYAVLGALARTAWGRKRTTTDIDLTMSVSAEELPKLTQILAEAGFERLENPRVPATGDPVPDLLTFAARHEDSTRPLKLDILVVKIDYQKEAVGRRKWVAVNHLAFWVVSPEDLIIHKLIAHRGRDLDDVFDVVETQDKAGYAMDWAYVKKWAKEWGVRKYLKPFLPKRVRAKGGKGSRKRRTSRR